MWRRWRNRILLFAAILGPGFITANVDNDSGGILTYSQAGAQYGYTLLWTMLPITIALIVVQEMCARMGVVTGKGLSDLIREEFGLRLTFVLMILLVVVNYTNVVTEFIGITGSLHLFHVTKFISVPLCAALVWFLVVKGNYKSTEKIFLIASVVYIAYIFAGVLSQPSWHDALLATVQLPPRSVWSNSDYLYTAIAIVGTTIAPWMQFYLQSSVVEKGIRVKDYPASRLDVIVGSFFTDIVAWFIVVACAATLFVHGMGAITVASDAAEAMRPLAGPIPTLAASKRPRFTLCGFILPISAPPADLSRTRLPAFSMPAISRLPASTLAETTCSRSWAAPTPDRGLRSDLRSRLPISRRQTRPAARASNDAVVFACRARTCTAASAIPSASIR